MVELNFERDKGGKYILEDFDERGYTKIHNAAADIKSGWSNSFLLDDGNNKCVIKTDMTNSYAVSIYGEMLFSKIAEHNGIDHAEYDASLYCNKPAAISKYIFAEDEEKLVCQDLVYRYEFDYSVEGIMQALLKFAAENDVILDKNLKNQLYKCALIDFLCCAPDRHAENLCFIIRDINGKKVLSLCPLYDNEDIFMFGEVRDKLRDIELGKNSVNPPVKNREEYEQVCIASAVKSSKNEYPLLGTNFDVESLKRMMAGDDILTAITDTSLCKKMLGNFATSFAVEMANNEELQKFYDSLNMDIFKFASQIENETGFKIPEKYLMLAEDVFYERKQLLDSEIKDYKQMVLGE